MMQIALTHAQMHPTNYIDTLIRYGAQPHLVCEASKEQASALARELDGLLLSGGGDVLPARYMQIQHPKTITEPERDNCEFNLLEAFIKADKPVLGICRGIQVIAVHFGASLHQHLPELGLPVDHTDIESMHPVKLHAGGFLHTLYGRDELRTNTRHHQALAFVPAGFRVAASAADGVIEAIQSEYIWGVQWHPERPEMADIAAPLFKGFLETVQKKKENQ